MAKRRHDPSPAEDYIDQLNWQANHPRMRGGWRGTSVRYEPKWKYKIGYRYPSLTFFGRIVVYGLVGLVVCLILSSKMEVGEKIFSSIMFGLIFLVFFFAGKDGSRDRNDDTKHLN